MAPIRRRALALVDAKDTNGAVQALRNGLAEKEILETRFAPKLEASMNAMLALLLLQKG